jgi:hypothetical protein
MKKLLRIWCIGLGILLLAEIAIRISSVSRIETQEEMLVSYQRAKIAKIEDGAILLVGDSSLGNGVSSKIVSQKLGGSVWNLALTASHNTYGDYIVIREVARSIKDVQGVVIFHNPGMWNSHRIADTEQTLNTAFETNNLQGLSNRLFHYSALVNFSATFRRLLVFGMRDGFDLDRLVQRLALLDEVRVQLPEVDYIVQQRILDRDAYIPVAGREFNPTPYVEKWLDETLAICSDAGWPVWLAVGPVPIAQAEISQESQQAMLNWLRLKAEAHPQCNLLYDHVPTAPIAHFGDGTSHLSPEAKISFSHWFADALLQTKSSNATLNQLNFWNSSHSVGN